MMYKGISVGIIILAFCLSGCYRDNVADEIYEEPEYVHHKIEVFPATVAGSRAEVPMFTESDILRAEYEDIEEDIDVIKLYFTEEYLSNFDSERLIEEYDSKPRVEGLKIYSNPGWDMFELYVDDEFLFSGHFPNGMLSSILYAGPWLGHEVDGVTICLNMGSEEQYGINEQDREVINKALVELGLIY